MQDRRTFFIFSLSSNSLRYANMLDSSESPSGISDSVDSVARISIPLLTSGECSTYAR